MKEKELQSFSWKNRKYIELLNLQIERVKKSGLSVDDLSLDERINRAGNPNTHEDELILYTEDKSIKVREELLKNEALKSWTFKALSIKTLIDYVDNIFSSDPVKNAIKNIAENPKTSIDIRKELAKDADKSIRIALAKNKSLTNEEFDLLLKDKDKDVLITLLKNPRASAELLIDKAINGTYKERLAVINNPSSPIEALEKLSKIEDVSISFQAINRIKEMYDKASKIEIKIPIKNEVGDSKIFTELEAKAYEIKETTSQIETLKAKDLIEIDERITILIKEIKTGKNILPRPTFIGIEDQETAAEDPKKNIRVLESLAYFGSAEVKEKIALNPSSTGRVLQLLLHNKKEINKDNCFEYYSIKENIARHKNINIDIIEELLKDNSRENNITKEYIAQNPNTPKEVLEQLYNDPDIYVKRAVASNPNTPSIILEILSKDSDTKLKQKIINHENCSYYTLKTLSKDADKFVRSAVASNPNTPIELLRELSKDEEVFVRKLVLQHSKIDSKTLIELSKDDNSDIKKEVVKHSDTPAEALEILSKDEDWLKLLVARHPNTSIDTLRELSKDEYKNIRLTVAENDNCPVDVLKKLNKDSDECVKIAVLCQLKDSSKVLNQYYKEELLKELSKDGNKEYLTLFAEDFEKVLNEVAKNPNTSEKDLDDDLLDLSDLKANYSKVSLDKNKTSNQNKHR